MMIDKGQQEWGGGVQICLPVMFIACLHTCGLCKGVHRFFKNLAATSKF